MLLSFPKEDCHIEGHYKCQYSGKEGWMDGLLRCFSQAFKKKNVELKLSLQWSLVFKKLWKTLILTFEEWSSLWWILRITQNRGWVSAMMIINRPKMRIILRITLLCFQHFWNDLTFKLSGLVSIFPLCFMMKWWTYQCLATFSKFQWMFWLANGLQI